MKKEYMYILQIQVKSITYPSCILLSSLIKIPLLFIETLYLYKPFIYIHIYILVVSYWILCHPWLSLDSIWKTVS